MTFWIGAVTSGGTSIYPNLLTIIPVEISRRIPHMTNELQRKTTLTTLFLIPLDIILRKREIRNKKSITATRKTRISIPILLIPHIFKEFMTILIQCKAQNNSDLKLKNNIIIQQKTLSQIYFKIPYYLYQNIGTSFMKFLIA